MRNFIIFSIFTFAFINIACKNETEKPKVTYNKVAKTAVKQIDTTKIKVADLPILFEGTRFLIYPIGSLNVANNSYTKYNSANDDTPSFSISNNMDNEITGYLENLKFQKVDSDSLISLTDKPIFLESTTYLKDFAAKTSKQVLVHLLADNDSNDDDKLDSNDIKSLYLSEISGANFTKLSIDFQEVINWKLIILQNRLYFKTIEDTNKNGRFDKGDKLHYNYVNLSEKTWKAIEYKPI